MRNLMNYGRSYGGADPQLIEGYIFRIVVTVPELAQGGKGLGTTPWRSGAQSESIVNALNSGPLSAAELVHQLGLKSKTGALKRSLQELLDNGLVEYTIPGKPSSRLQKYRLTEKGQTLLAELAGGDQ